MKKITDDEILFYQNMFVYQKTAGMWCLILILTLKIAPRKNYHFKIYRT